MSATAEEFFNEHIDVSIKYKPEAIAKLDFELFIERTRFVSLTNAVLVAREEAQLTLPGGTPFGEEGDSIWILPQSQNTSLLYMGFSAEEIPLGIFDGPLEVQLVSVDGPGNFFMWQSTSVGNLEIKMNTRDGIGPEDKTVPFIGSHEHVNWGFSTNGIYKVTFLATGRRMGEETNVFSEPQTLVFHVLPLPASLTPFQQWQLEKFGQGALENVKGAAADPDGDTVQNIFEYAFGLDPLNPPRMNLPSAWINTNGAGIEFSRAIRATDLNISIEFTDSLDSMEWQSANGTFVVLEENSDIQRVRFKDDAAPGSTRFYKLQLSLSP
ncbi:MAG: choice-of-anchor M domain-containing protein [Verrucomicrobiota bacterium]|nr:choice-of-anchor M domain-containing protein [Verrucomicrobiota bacterium]